MVAKDRHRKSLWNVAGKLASSHSPRLYRHCGRQGLQFLGEWRRLLAVTTEGRCHERTFYAAIVKFRSDPEPGNWGLSKQRAVQGLCCKIALARAI